MQMQFCIQLNLTKVLDFSGQILTFEFENTLCRPIRFKYTLLIFGLLTREGVDLKSIFWKSWILIFDKVSAYIMKNLPLTRGWVGGKVAARAHLLRCQGWPLLGEHFSEGWALCSEHFLRGEEFWESTFLRGEHFDEGWALRWGVTTLGEHFDEGWALLGEHFSKGWALFMSTS